MISLVWYLSDIIFFISFWQHHHPLSADFIFILRSIWSIFFRNRMCLGLSDCLPHPWKPPCPIPHHPPSSSVSPLSTSGQQYLHSPAKWTRSPWRSGECTENFSVLSVRPCSSYSLVPSHCWCQIWLVIQKHLWTQATIPITHRYWRCHHRHHRHHRHQGLFSNQKLLRPKVWPQVRPKVWPLVRPQVRSQVWRALRLQAQALNLPGEWVKSGIMWRWLILVLYASTQNAWQDLAKLFECVIKHCVHTFTMQNATQVKSQIAQTLSEISAKTSPPSENSSKKVWPMQMLWWEESYLSIAL